MRFSSIALAIALGATISSCSMAGDAPRAMFASESPEAAMLSERRIVGERMEMLDDDTVRVSGTLVDGYGTPVQGDIVLYELGGDVDYSVVSTAGGAFFIDIPREHGNGRSLASVSWQGGADASANAEAMAEMAREYELASHARRMLSDGGVTIGKSESRSVTVDDFAALVGAAHGSYDREKDSCIFVWEAERDLYADEAPASGRLSEWEVGYYIVHSWSVYGQALLFADAGDVIEVNGVRCMVDGYFDISKECYDIDVRYFTGEDAIVFQTCVPNSSFHHIVFASRLDG